MRRSFTYIVGDSPGNGRATKLKLRSHGLHFNMPLPAASPLTLITSPVAVFATGDDTMDIDQKTIEAGAAALTRPRTAHPDR